MIGFNWKIIPIRPHQAVTTINSPPLHVIHRHWLKSARSHCSMAWFQREFFVLVHHCRNHCPNRNLWWTKYFQLIRSVFFLVYENRTFLRPLSIPKGFFRLNAITVFVNFGLLFAARCLRRSCAIQWNRCCLWHWLNTLIYILFLFPVQRNIFRNKKNIHTKNLQENLR